MKINLTHIRSPSGKRLSWLSAERRESSVTGWNPARASKVLSPNVRVIMCIPIKEDTKNSQQILFTTTATTTNTSNTRTSTITANAIAIACYFALTTKNTTTTAILPSPASLLFLAFYNSTACGSTFASPSPSELSQNITRVIDSPTFQLIPHLSFSLPTLPHHFIPYQYFLPLTLHNPP